MPDLTQFSEDFEPSGGLFGARLSIAAGRARAAPRARLSRRLQLHLYAAVVCGWRRRIVIEKVGAASSVMWNPWAEKAGAMADLGDPAWRGMVCVETGNVADNEVRLAADDEHQMSTAIAVRSAASDCFAALAMAAPLVSPMAGRPPG